MNACDVCQRMNKKVVVDRPELHPIPVKSTWYHGIDFVGPISPPSSTGNRYIMTVRQAGIDFVGPIPLSFFLLEIGTL